MQDTIPNNFSPQSFKLYTESGCPVDYSMCWNWIYPEESPCHTSCGVSPALHSHLFCCVAQQLADKLYSATHSLTPAPLSWWDGGENQKGRSSKIHELS